MIPKLTYPIHIIKQPSTGLDLKFRPYRVVEEKILLMAKESLELKDKMLAVKQIVQECALDPKFNADKISLFDIEYIFLKLRAISVNNKEQIIITDNEDKKEYVEIINFDDIEVNMGNYGKSSNAIELGNDLSIIMKFPDISVYNENNEDMLDKIKNNDLFTFILACVDKVLQKNTLVKMSAKELEEFINNIDVKSFRKMKEFIINIPRIEYKITYKNSLGNSRYLKFNSLMDFFLFL